MFRHGQDEMGRSVRNRGVVEKNSHQERLVVSYVADHDPQQIIPLSRHRKAFQNFWPAAHEIFERGAGFDGMATVADIADHVDAAAHLAGIDHPHRGAQDIRLFQSAHPPPDRRGRTADPRGEFRMAKRRIRLEFSDDPSIDSIQMIRLFHIFRIPEIYFVNIADTIRL